MFAQTVLTSLLWGSLLFITSTSTTAILSNDKNIQLIETPFCEYYKEELCKNKTVEECTTKEPCSTDEDRRHQCFVLWHVDNTTGDQTLKLKGCFSDNVGCSSKEKCVANAVAPKKNLHYCCCEGNMCNTEYSWKPIPVEPEPTKVLPTVSAESSLWYVLLYSAAAAVLLIILAGLSFWIKKTHQSRRYNESPTQALLPSIPPSPSDGLGPIQLIEVKASGRFGSVWKSKCNGEEVAVKIFPFQDQNSWLAEQEVFKLPHMSHPDILHFLGVEKRGDNLQADFWLVTAYHHRGSLCDYLKAHTVTWLEMGRIAESISTGLTHLHNEIPGKGSYTKPAVAHRDFKSKNVLLKNDMSACIADFGLALIFQPGKPCGDTHGQVGTRRYMAPEVLEGAINFTLDAFLRIDMYACGLVLWELASRCSDQDGEIPEYKLPFEVEIGTHPTLEEMQEAVVTKKVRPAILEKWNNHLGLKSMVSTMEECWDHDAEARLSASCVMERVSHLMRYTPQHNEELIVEPNGKVPI